MKKILFTLTILMILFAIIGCGPSGENYEPPSEAGECPASYWNDYWGYPQFISFFDDSLAIYKTLRYKTEYYKEYFLFEGEKCVPFASEYHTGLWLANYKVKQKPILVDTLDYDLKIVSGYVNDSSLLVIKDGEFGFWKMGNGSVEFKEMNPSEFAAATYSSNIKANPWIDGNILLKASGYKELVLNTETGRLDILNISEQNEWLNSCKDKFYTGDKMFCFRFNDESIHWELVVDGIVTDTRKLDNGVLRNKDQLYYLSLALSEQNKWLSSCYEILYIDGETICKFEDKSIVFTYESLDDMKLFWEEVFHENMNFEGKNYAIGSIGGPIAHGSSLIKIDLEKLKFDASFEPILINSTIKYSEEDF